MSTLILAVQIFVVVALIIAILWGGRQMSDANLRRLAFEIMLRFPTTRDDSRRLLAILAELLPLMHPSGGDADHPLRFRRGS
jgi:hypothetical protein